MAGHPLRSRFARTRPLAASEGDVDIPRIPFPVDSRLRGNDEGLCGNDEGLCHSEGSEESLVLGLRFFTPLRSVQNDMAAALRSERHGCCATFRMTWQCQRRTAPNLDSYL